jgi:hypothetical protein
MWMRDGELRKYTGDRTVKGFAALSARLAAPVVRDVPSLSTAADIFGGAPVAFVLVAPGAGEGSDPAAAAAAAAAAFAHVAGRYQDSHAFVRADSAAALAADRCDASVALALRPALEAAAANNTAGAAVAVRLESGEPPVSFAVGSGTQAAVRGRLQGWVGGARFPLVTPLERGNFFELAHAGTGRLLAVLACVAPPKVLHCAFALPLLCIRLFLHFSCPPPPGGCPEWLHASRARSCSLVHPPGCAPVAPATRQHQTLLTSAPYFSGGGRGG